MAGGASAAAAGVPRATGRDLRLDFFRGLGLLFIFIDHIPNNAFSYLTLANFSFCDAAEIFVFLSGYSAALVFGREAGREGNAFAMAQVLKRCWALYVAHIFLFVIYTAQVSWTAQRFENALFIEEMEVAAFLNEPHVAIVKALELVHQPLFMNILPLYIVLLTGFAVALPLLRRLLWALVAVSAVVYAIVPLVGFNLAAYPEGVWFFNPFAWQFIFVLGIACGWKAGVEGNPVRIPRGAVLAALAFLALAVPARLWVSVGYFLDGVPPAFADLVYQFANKTDLGPLRLGSFLALAVAVVHLVPRSAAWLASAPASAVVLCGQNSLQVFCLGIFLSVSAHSLLLEFGHDISLQAAVTFGGCLLLLGAARVLSWSKSRKSRRAGGSSGDGGGE
ncbi:MAG: OpgC domain-containing protein [Rhodospirillales bacterium]|nr:OpgC domain-containing protein [Rhodospirillales bacterium]